MRGLVDPGPTERDPDDYEVAYNSDDSELSGQGRVGAEDRAEADEMRLREKLPGHDSEVSLFGSRLFFSCGKLLCESGLPCRVIEAHFASQRHADRQTRTPTRQHAHKKQRGRQGDLMELTTVFTPTAVECLYAYTPLLLLQASSSSMSQQEPMDPLEREELMEPRDALWKKFREEVCAR